MKIEVCESLCASWLKHKKRCLVVQTNWKASPAWCTHRSVKVKELVEAVRAVEGVNVIKKNAGADQMIRQTECDVLGVSFEHGKLKWYAIESAFHSRGLLYGNKTSTADKVFSKMFRIAMVLYDYMKADSAEIIFASPQTSKAVEQSVKTAFDKLVAFFKRRRPGFKFRLFIGQDFKRRIFDPLMNLREDVTDSAELFMRAAQLIDLSSPTFLEHKKCMIRKMRHCKVGRLVNENMRRVLETMALECDVLEELQDEEFCKTTFNINAKLLTRVYPPQNDSVEHTYANHVKIGTKKFRMHNLWVESHRNAIEEFLLDFDPENCGFDESSHCLADDGERTIE